MKYTNTYVSDFKSFLLEKKSKDVDDDKSLPKEIHKSVFKILDDNFELASKKSIVGNVVTFKVSESDFKYVDPEQNLELELSEGSAKKRKYDVSLKFVKAIKADDGGELVYLIDFKPMELSDKFKKKEKEEEDFVDEYEKPEEEDEIPEISKGKKGLSKFKDFDSNYRTGGYVSGGDDDEEELGIPDLIVDEIEPPIVKSVKKPKIKISEIEPKIKIPEIEPTKPKSNLYRVRKPIKMNPSESISDYLIRNLLTGVLTRKEIDEILMEKLPDHMTFTQKKDKIGNVLWDLKLKGIIKNIGPTKQQPIWKFMGK